MIGWSYERQVLGLCTMAFFATMVARLAISPVVPTIRADLDISNTVIGFALSGMWLTYALSQYPSGLLGDRYGERIVILVAVVGTAVGSLLIAASTTAALFVLATLLLGALAGLHYSVATSLLTKVFPQTGTAIGIHSVGAPIAGLVTPVAAAWVGTTYGWRPAVALGAVAAVPTAVLFALGVRSREPARPEQPIRERLRLQQVVELLSRPQIAFTTLLAICGAFAWQGTASFLPAFLIESRGYSETAAGVAFSAYFVVQGVGQPGVGSLSDRFGREPMAALTMLAAVVGYSLFVFGHRIWGVAAAVVCIGIGMSWGAALMPKFMDNLSPEEQGMGFGLVRTTYMVVGASGSVAIGAIADWHSWNAAFLLLAGLTGAVFLALVVSMLAAKR